MAPKKRTTRASPATTTTTTPVTNAQLKALIGKGIDDALAARDTDRSRIGDDNHNSGTGVSVWEGAEEVQSIIHIKSEKCKKMKLSQDMQLFQKLCDDQKRNIVTNSRVTPSWKEIVSLAFSEVGVLHMNLTSLGHCLKALIGKGVDDALAARDTDRSRIGDDNHNSGTGSRRT
nr:hypothetical protein [Tanacetum cinerariifolium]